MIYQMTAIYEELPVKVRNFLIRALFVFICWLMLYHLILKPIGIPDKQLTWIIKECTAIVLSWFYPAVHTVGNYIYTDNTFALGIADECNGFELIALYIGFLACLPTNARRFISFAVVGTLLICILNVLRCAGLAWMNINHNSMMDFAHHYAFKLVIYAFVFFAWITYSKKFTPGVAKAA